MKYKVEVFQNGRSLGSSEHWDKETANRTFKKQAAKSDTTVVMYDPSGRKIRG